MTSTAVECSGESGGRRRALSFVRAAGVVVLLAISFAGVTSATAQPAGEQQFAGMRAHSVIADAGFVSFLASPDEQRLLFRGRQRLLFPGDALDARFGTDRHGHRVITFLRCNSGTEEIGVRRQCAVHERALRSGKDRVLLRAADNRHVFSPVVDRGDLLFGRNFLPGRVPGRDGGLFLRRHGTRRMARLSGEYPHELAVGARRALYTTVRDVPDREPVERVRLVDLGTRRTRTVDTGGFDDATRSGRRLSSPTIDGHYAYWLVTTSRNYQTTGQPSTTEIERLDLRSRASVPESFTPGFPATSMTVDHGQLIYTTDVVPNQGVWIVEAPTFRPRH
jgi:hypothetical protein